jgi:thymidylate synthase
MHLKAETLDDLLRKVYRLLLRSPYRVRSSKGRNREVPGVLLELKTPTARLSRTETKGTVFSCLGETLWYLSGSDQLEPIAWYMPLYRKSSDDKRTIYGAYGPRLRLMRGKVDQLAEIIKLLKKKPQTRQAVIQLFNAEDILKPRKDIPCTCTIQFLIRNKRLHVLTNMRSNDAFLGLPHDVFAFTFIQELIARSIGVQLGTYKHAVGSLHLYDKDRNSTQEFLREGWQSTIVMPKMPPGDPWKNLRKLIVAERRIHSGKRLSNFETIPRYWRDLTHLLQIFANTGRKSTIRRLKSQMTSDVYNPYIEKRATMSIPARFKGVAR